jgi:ABC transport system ATP-binding/permease protein
VDTPPPITVCSGDVRRTFPPDRDVVVGRDVRADVRIPHPAVSRAHMILRCVDGSWTATDNKSFNGMFVGKERVRQTPVRDGGAIRLADREGPLLTFDLGPPPDERPTVQTKLPAIFRGGSTDAGFRGRWRGTPPPQTTTTTIGRAPDNDIVVADVMASRHHARMVAAESGVQIQDAHSINGTFVNGRRVKSAALRDNDVVTIGNVDFVFVGRNLVRRTEAAATTGGLEVHEVGVMLKRGDVTLLDRMSLTARPGTLTAVIGPSGSGKSTLAKVIVGAWQPTRGAVTFDGRNLHADYASLRSRIGMVPQDDVVHRGLTVTQALTFAAQMRMPPDTTKIERQQVISRVLDELEMTAQADTRVDKLSGGQRKRVSVAMELLTEPSLLVLDEPTTGLDPALDRQVMAMLRHLADAGRVIVVVTHSLKFLDMCDQVVLLAPGGKTAYCGPPADLAATLGSTDWADIFSGISADPDAAQRRFLERRGPVAQRPGQPSPAQPPSLAESSRTTSFWRQFAAVSLRQVQLILADRRYLIFLVALPVLVGLLPLTVGGKAGFNKPPPGATAPFEPRQIIVLLSFAAILMGITLTVRDLIGERSIYRHEQSAGLSPWAYLLAKIWVFGAVAVAQSVLLVLVVTAPKLGKRAPSTAAVLGSPMLELFVDVAATAVAAVVLGLAISAVSRSSNQYIPLLAVVCVAQLVFAGSFVPVTGRPVLEAIAALTPARWGVAATASTVDLTNLVPVVQDSLWKHSATTWLLDIAMLGVLALAFALFVRWRLRRTAS